MISIKHSEILKKDIGVSAESEEVQMNIIEKLGKKFKGERTLSTLIIIFFMLSYWVLIYSPFRLAFTIMTALICVPLTYELLKSVKCKSKGIYLLSMSFSAIEVFLLSYKQKIAVSWNIILTAYILILLITMVIEHEKIEFTQIGIALIGSVAYSYALSCFILIRDMYEINPSYSKQDCFWLVLATFGASWLTDAGAFLVGRKLGKHKLCPKISPKKSVEGAIGGVVILAIFANLVYFIYDIIIYKIYGFHTFGGNSVKKYAVLGAIYMFLAVLSMFGDLSASVHKRQVGIKDYSNLLPGHGGIMDRFDSSVFVVPAMYAIISSIPYIF